LPYKYFLVEKFVGLVGFGMAAGWLAEKQLLGLFSGLGSKIQSKNSSAPSQESVEQKSSTTVVNSKAEVVEEEEDEDDENGEDEGK
jgi:hypothetical protein